MIRLARPTQLRSADRQGAWAVFLVLFGLYAASLSTPFDNPDAEVEYQTTRSLALGRGLAVTPQTPEGAALLAVGFNLRPGADGRMYSWFGIGQAGLAVPFWWVGHGMSHLFPMVEARHRESPLHMGVARSEYFEHLWVALRNPLLAAATGALLVWIARRLGASRAAALCAALSYGLLTFAWPQARSSLSDVQAAFFAALALDGWLRARESLDRLERPRRRDLLLTGLALGGALTTRIATAPLVFVLASLVLWTLWTGHRRLRRQALLRQRSGPRGLSVDLICAGAPLVALVALLLAANWMRFGDPLETGYGAALGSFFGYSPLAGLAGLVLSPGRGLLALAPLVVLVPYGLWRLRADRLATLGILAGSAATALLVAPSQGWHGAWTFGPRYLLPALPLLFGAVAVALDRLLVLRRGWLAYGPPAVLGLVVALGGVFVDHTTHQDLAVRAAAQRWPDTGLEPGRPSDEARFLNIQWDWHFAAPFAHWRILRHRVAGLGEQFPPGRIFGVEGGEPLTPSHARDQGFSHFAWVDLHQRLGGRVSGVLALCAALFALGGVFASRALDPTRP